MPFGFINPRITHYDKPKKESNKLLKRMRGNDIYRALVGKNGLPYDVAEKIWNTSHPRLEIIIPKPHFLSYPDLLPNYIAWERDVDDYLNENPLPPLEPLPPNATFEEIQRREELEFVHERHEASRQSLLRYGMNIMTDPDMKEQILQSEHRSRNEDRMREEDFRNERNMLN